MHKDCQKFCEEGARERCARAIVGRIAFDKVRLYSDTFGTLEFEVRSRRRALAVRSVSQSHAAYEGLEESREVRRRAKHNRIRDRDWIR